MRGFYPTITPLLEEQDSSWREGNRSIHRHHGGGVWSEEALHLMFVRCRKAELRLNALIVMVGLGDTTEHLWSAERRWATRGTSGTHSETPAPL